MPYGIKSIPTIEHFTGQITDFLLDRGVKMLVVACNTMAAVAAHVVKSRAGDIPVLDVIDAGAGAAVAASRSGTIGVIGTPTTVNPTPMRGACAIDPDIRVFSQACPLFVPLVEEGWLEHEVTRLTAREYLKPVLAEEVDTLVLGTHYPLLKPLLQDVSGPDIRLVDSAITTAELAAARLASLELANPGHAPAHYAFHVTDIPLRFQTIGERFLGRSLSHLSKVDW